MKKLEVTSYIGKYNERGRKSFENKVASILRQQNLIGDFKCDNAYMKRANGSGSYYMCADIILDNHIFHLKKHTHDSEMWDNWNEPTTKEKRNLFLSVLENEIDNLCEQIIEEINEDY
jgi:hypothetical protein